MYGYTQQWLFCNQGEKATKRPRKSKQELWHYLRVIKTLQIPSRSHQGRDKIFILPLCLAPQQAPVCFRVTWKYDGCMNEWMGWSIDWQTDERTGGQTDKRTDWRTDGLTNGQTNRQKDRWTDSQMNGAREARDIQTQHANHMILIILQSSTNRDSLLTYEAAPHWVAFWSNACYADWFAAAPTPRSQTTLCSVRL